MVKRLWVLAVLVSLSTGCEWIVSSVRVSGSTEDGETFRGILDDTASYGISGLVEITSNRGIKCAGRFKYAGTYGPGGTMWFTCDDGRTGEGTLDGHWGVGTARGSVADKPFTLKLGGW